MTTVPAAEEPSWQLVPLLLQVSGHISARGWGGLFLALARPGLSPRSWAPSTYRQVRCVRSESAASPLRPRRHSLTLAALPPAPFLPHVQSLSPRPSKHERGIRGVNACPPTAAVAPPPRPHQKSWRRAVSAAGINEELFLVASGATCPPPSGAMGEPLERARPPDSLLARRKSLSPSPVCVSPFCRGRRVLAPN